MVSQRVSGYLILVGVFAVGAACGGGAAFAYVAEKHAAILRDDARGPETRRLRSLARRLDLDAAQEERIRTILSEDRDTTRELGKTMLERCGEPLREQKMHVDAAIREVLRPEQQRRYDRLLEQRERLLLGPEFFPRRGGNHEP